MTWVKQLPVGESELAPHRAGDSARDTYAEEVGRSLQHVPGLSINGLRNAMLRSSNISRSALGT
ncbi:hypothetical protein J6590_017289 [Homalodisca vitripennis]|nr:hypothetical protein J6590_017289 [Homalodisca vitripennis]